MASSLRVLKWIAVVDAAAVAANAAVVWLGGWRDLATFVSGLTYASLALVAVGGFAAVAASQRPADLRDRWLRSESGESLPAQVSEDVQIGRGAVEITAFCVLAAVPLLALWMALRALAG